VSAARVGPECVSELLLDRLVAGELAAPERGAVLRHLAGCPNCADRQRRREQEAQSFAATAPPLRRAQPVAAAPVIPLNVAPSRRRGRVLAGAAGVAALAAAVVLVPLVRQSGGGRPGIKGPGLVQVFVNHEGSLREYLPGDTVSSGDALAFILQPAPPPASHLVVLGRDGSGAVKVYHPEDGSAAAPLALARDGSLPFSVQLDATPGPEAFLFYVCTAPVPVAAIRTSLQAPGDGAVPACERHAVVLEKTTPP